MTKQDFELLVNLHVFNDGRMNNAVLGFKGYEDASLSYTGHDKHSGVKEIGAWDRKVSAGGVNKNGHEF